jgi:hypothetical protein
MLFLLISGASGLGCIGTVVVVAGKINWWPVFGVARLVATGDREEEADVGVLFTGSNCPLARINALDAVNLVDGGVEEIVGEVWFDLTTELEFVQLTLMEPPVLEEVLPNRLRVSNELKSIACWCCCSLLLLFIADPVRDSKSSLDWSDAANMLMS